MSYATLSQFRAKFPEFDAVPDALIQVNLDEAALEIDPDIWDNARVAKSPVGNMYLAAHKLTLSPYGQAARLPLQTKRSWGPSTTYRSHYEDLLSQVTCGYGRVV